jgi:hypothetical protein
VCITDKTVHLLPQEAVCRVVEANISSVGIVKHLVSQAEHLLAKSVKPNRWQEP